MIPHIWLEIKWAVIDFYLWLRSLVFGENDHLKRFEEPNALSRRYGFNRIIEIKDFQFWDTVPVFSPHQAACLISGYSPGFYKGDYPPEVEAMMVDLIKFHVDSAGDIEANFINVCKSKRIEILIAPSLELKRTNLIDYCLLNNLTPLFLYPEKREKLSTAEIDLAKIKEELAETRKINEELKIGAQSPYLDRNHPMFSEELYIAITIWQELFSSGEDVKKMKRKASGRLIHEWLEKNQRNLSHSAKKRFKTLCNPDIYKAGGATSTEVY